MSQDLHCLNCWATEPAGKRTECRRCGHPLYLPDGRRVGDLVAAAQYEAAQYAAYGYHPEMSPAVQSANQVFAAAPRGGINWVTVVRGILVFQGALGCLLYLLLGLVLRSAASSSGAGSRASAAIGIGFFILIVITLAVTALFVWLASIAAMRVLLLGLSGLALYLSFSSHNIVVIGVELIFQGFYITALVMSLVRPPEPRYS